MPARSPSLREERRGLSLERRGRAGKGVGGSDPGGAGESRGGKGRERCPKQPVPGAFCFPGEHVCPIALPSSGKAEFSEKSPEQKLQPFPIPLPPAQSLKEGEDCKQELKTVGTGFQFNFS